MGIQLEILFTFEARKAFTKLKQAFVKTLILNYFDLKCYIQIKTDIFGYAINGIPSQLTLNDLGQWYLVAFYFQKMILIRIWYETYNDKLLAIVKVFKTWRHYLEGYKYEVFILIDYNNL